MRHRELFAQITEAGWEKELIQAAAYQLWELYGSDADTNWFAAKALLKRLYLI